MPVGAMTPAGSEPVQPFHRPGWVRRGEAALFRAYDGAFPAPPPITRASQSHPVAVPLPQGIAEKAPITLVLARLANRLARPAVCHLEAQPAAVLAAPGIAPVPVGLNHRHGSRLCYTALAQPGKWGRGPHGEVGAAMRWHARPNRDRRRRRRETRPDDGPMCQPFIPRLQARAR